MKHYVWFHPNYISHEDTVEEATGQQDNFKTNGYIILHDKELDKVRPADHLTIIGAPAVPADDDERPIKEQAGINNIGGDNVVECVERLVKLGLQYAPKVLTLELRHAGIPGGFAQELSKSFMFKYSVIEANAGVIGRNPRSRAWSFPTDSLGRSTQIDSSKKADVSDWHFYLSGYLVATHKHQSYKLETVLEELSPKGFHDSFFANYKPGWRGGRVGRHCAKQGEITLGQALFFANDNRTSATAAAVGSTLQSMYAPAPK